MVLAVVYRNRRLRTLTNACIINLAVSDILMAVLCMPLTTTSLITVEWSMADAACKFQGILGVSLSFISLQTMTLTAVNRYFRIVRPGKYPSIFTKRSTIIMIAAIWLVGLSFGELYVWASGGEIVFIQTAGTCFPRIAPLIVSILGYLLPSLLIFVCYFLVYKAVRRHSLTVTCSLQRGEQPLGPSCQPKYCFSSCLVLFCVGCRRKLTAWFSQKLCIHCHQSTRGSVLPLSIYPVQ